MKWPFRLRAISMIEVSLSLVIASVFFAGIWSALGAISQKIYTIQTQCYLEQISQAAAKYAADRGYLPLPLSAEMPRSEDPDDLLGATLRGYVPWKELGLPREPMVNGKKFIWIVAATAVQRPGWQYLPVDREVHLLPTFHAKKRQATFARPGWCGLYRDVDEVSAVNLKSYLESPERYKYVVRPVLLKDEKYEYDDAPLQLTQLRPKLPHSTTIGGGVLQDVLEVYELELEVGMYYIRSDIEESKYSPLSSYLGDLLCSEDRLMRSVIRNYLSRVVWVNEPVLAISYNAKQPLKENQLSVEQNAGTAIWTRYALLSYAGYFDTLMYTHPGYKWDVLNKDDEFESPANALPDLPKPGPVQQRLPGDERSSCKTHYIASVNQSAPSSTLPERYARDLIKHGLIALGSKESKPAILIPSYYNNNPEEYYRDYHTDFLCSAYLLEWAKAILQLDQIVLFRKRGIPNLMYAVKPDDAIVESKIFKQVAHEIAARLRHARDKLKKELQEFTSDYERNIDQECDTHAATS